MWRHEQTMTKKNLKPQLAAPVQREINTTSSESATGLIPLSWAVSWPFQTPSPFAGDDAE